MKTALAFATLVAGLTLGCSNPTTAPSDVTERLTNLDTAVQLKASSRDTTMFCVNEYPDEPSRLAGALVKLTCNVFVSGRYATDQVDNILYQWQDGTQSGGSMATWPAQMQQHVYQKGGTYNVQVFAHLKGTGPGWDALFNQSVTVYSCPGCVL